MYYALRANKETLKKTHKREKRKKHNGKKLNGKKCGWR